MDTPWKKVLLSPFTDNEVKIREVAQLAQSYPAGKWQEQDSNPRGASKLKVCLPNYLTVVNKQGG